MIDRERRMGERRIKAARFPTVKSLDSFDFLALPSLNKMLVLELVHATFATPLEDNPLEFGEKHLAAPGWDTGKHLR